MARLPRLSVAGYPHHVILRGNNRQVIFHDDADRQLMLGLLAEHAKDKRLALHAYVLMDNHVHLLATPAQEGGLSRFMQAVGRTYVKRFNVRWGRSGTLWEGRFRSGLVQTDRHFLACMIYLDLNPVRAGLVDKAQDHRWSSHRHYVGMEVQSWLTPHALYWSLGNTPFSREHAYSQLVASGLPSPTVQAMTEGALKGMAFGDAGFLTELQQLTRRRVHASKPGRPVNASGQRRGLDKASS